MEIDIQDLDRISNNPGLILRIMVLTKWEKVNDSIELYEKRKFKGRFLKPTDTHILHSALKSLFRQIRGSLKDTERDEYIENLKKADFENLSLIFDNLTDWLTQKKLLQFDTKIDIPRHSAVKSNYIRSKLS